MTDYTVTLVDRKGLTHEVLWIAENASKAILATQEHYPTHRIVRVRRADQWS